MKQSNTHAQMAQARRHLIRGCFQLLKLIVNEVGFSIPHIAGTCLQESSCVVVFYQFAVANKIQNVKTSDSFCRAVLASQLLGGDFLPSHLKQFTMKKAVGDCSSFSLFMSILLKLTLSTHPAPALKCCASFIKRNPCVWRPDVLELGKKQAFPISGLLLFPHRHP